MNLIAGNGVYAEDGRYAMPPQTFKSFAKAIGDDSIRTPGGKAPQPWLNAGSLAEVGWGLVTPYGEERLESWLCALRPLLELRHDQAGDLFHGRLDYHPGSSVNRFLTSHGSGPGAPDPEKVPYYLLLLGGPESIPFEFQYLLDVQYAVGRLSFDSVEEYANYAAAVVACERGEVHRHHQVDLFSVRNWDDLPTAMAEAGLVAPLTAKLDKEVPWHINTWSREAASKARLLDLFSGKSSILFTASHGVLYRSGSSNQERKEGSLLCYDWPGPKSKASGVLPEHFFASSDLDPDWDLRGLIAFLFACNSAGTPRLDAYSRARGEQIPMDAARNFIAPLPTSLLGRPEGALAVVGHVDGVWPLSYRWSSLETQIGHFEAFFRELIRGLPVGHALDQFGQRYSNIATIIADEIEQDRTGSRDSADALSQEEEQVYLWTAHNDARSYVLLGDPAVRPVARTGS